MPKQRISSNLITSRTSFGPGSTLAISIVNEPIFWNDALSAAREADNRVELEKLMDRKFEQHRDEFGSPLLSISYAINRHQDNMQSSAGLEAR
ncbi:hypothetical protein PHISCL_09155 [Aspergillus sclerotialis]|uniref:Uncharacterized protein n=1 Tax=Aspergillus sclerotialis TaxID=2070753 RepID=A0A3A2Z5X2_9EURO|nr:hypothetical protein PHISCL_09155 [Aspergillus sclerotialis]